MGCTIASPDLIEATSDVHKVSRWSCGHVAIDKLLSQSRFAGSELPCEYGCKASFTGFDESTGVMSHQTTEVIVGLVYIPDVPSTVQGVESS